MSEEQSMAEHHPMTHLHRHLDQVALHGARITNAADTAVTAAEARRRAERPDDGGETLPAEGR